VYLIAKAIEIYSFPQTPNKTLIQNFSQTG